MKLTGLARVHGGPVLYGLATGFAVGTVSVGQSGWVGLVTGAGFAIELAGLSLLTVLGEPPPPYAVGLANYRRPIRFPSGRNRTRVAGVLVAIMVAVLLLLPAWAGLVLMLMAGAALTASLVLAWQAKRGRSHHRDRIHRAVAQHAPRFVVYTGRQDEGSYQLAMWIPVLEQLELPYLVVLRHPEAVASVRTVSEAPVVVCPDGGDLDAVIVDGLRVACYVNAVAANSTMLAYRRLTHVYLGHGDSDKELSVHPMHAMFDRVFVAGQAAIDRYEQAGVTIPRQRFVIVGRPQLAGIGTAAGPIADIEQPRVLYAPTWRGYNRQTSLSSLSVGIKIVAALVARGVAVTFRPHPFSWQGSQERAWIAAVDQHLRRERSRSGTPHQLASEDRNSQAVAQFDDSDALITDIGSALVDYFATGKPYAVVLPRCRSIDTVRTDLPSTAGAYLIESEKIIEHGTDALSGILDDLLRLDPMRGRRSEVARHFLGDEPADDRPFLAAMRELVVDQPGRRPV